MLQYGTIPTSEFLCLTTNQATDAIKAIVHTVTINVRKLKKKNVKNIEQTWQLNSKCSKCHPSAFTQACSVELKNKKKFCRN